MADFGATLLGVGCVATCRQVEPVRAAALGIADDG
jgi:hypothetical protein